MKLQIKKIRRKGQVYLLEYTTTEDFVHQVFVPVDVCEEVDNNHVLVDEYELEIAIPFGFQWEYVLNDVVVSAEVIARALYRNGIRTYEDLQNKPNEFIGAIKEAAAPIHKSIKLAISNSHEEAKP